MKTFRLVSLALFALLLTACAGMQGSKDANIESLIKAAGIDAQLAQLQQPLDPKATQGAGALIPDEIIGAINATVSDSLKPEQIRSDLKTALARNMSQAELRSALNFYESGPGQNVVAADKGTLSNRRSLSADEDARLSELDRATGTSQAVSQLAEQGMSSAIGALTSSNCLGLSKAPMGGLLGGFFKKSQMAVVRQSVRSSLNARYSALSASDLDAYLRFAQSEAGQHFFGARNEVFSKAAGNAGKSIADMLVQQLAKSCGG